MTYNKYTISHSGVLGMKWGVRRYQNKDGSLTEAGKARYRKDLTSRQNQGQNIDEKKFKADPHRWVKEDLESEKRVVDSASELVRKSQEIEKTTRPPKTRMDLSNMTEKEMREKINRELVERQYNDLFNKQKISKGRQRVRDALDIGGTLLALTSSSLGIALAIHNLKG